MDNVRQQRVDSWMIRRTVALARRGGAATAPNPMVGALVVQDGCIVGRGWHRRAGGPHAEVFALEEAAERARHATLYVSLEPCNHHGKTPACTDAILAAGVSRVVYGMKDPNPSVLGGGAAMLRDGGVDVRCEHAAGIVEDFYRPWVHWLKTGRPFVTLKLAVSIDGRIAADMGSPRWLSCAVSRARV
ncbi:MAG: bifunctional diaminohydroxyphosphoribosylaminopyrimidine deaminase/5-amino-6-(5-phosphoribosylamino)uracil reductase RibD, partial [Bdellovibrionales bacterium]|nr:bifunctional diaminohydroxyphosphoribosylaminopyrimidine deaminase/5-amino-6-(5-phosphoribosylamino)uracil reductase RibD [Bdellovibrionales bacterium]